HVRPTVTQLVPVFSCSQCACFVFFFQAEDGIRDRNVTGVQTCALPISRSLAVRKMTGSPLSLSFSSRQKSNPFPSGRLTSSITRSKLSSSASCLAFFIL